MIAFIGLVADMLIICLFIAGVVVACKTAKAKMKREEDLNN